jgi:Tol biopolymer transport system component/DNA-binding winged helix-turn-helix (wHTH) protein
MMANKSFIFIFDDIEVREREFSVVKAGEVLPVEPKAFRVLLILLRNPQKLISKEELLNAVWGDAAVTENSLTRSIALLRRLLGDETRNPRYIETVATVGYRFLCKVEVSEDTAGIFEAGQAVVNGEVAEVAAYPRAQTDVDTSGGTKSGKPHGGKGWRLRKWLITLILVVGLATAIWLLRPALPPPTVIGMTPLTQDGVAKSFLWLAMPMFTEGSRIYFQEVTPYHAGPLMQVSTEGGETASIDNPLPSSTLVGISPNGLELLLRMGNKNDDSYTFWRLPLVGLQPHQIGNLTVDWGEAAWSPDGSVLYYGSGSDIFAADADGSRPRRLLTTTGHPMRLSVSPDGSLLRFSVTDSQFAKFSLWEAHSDGSGLRQLFPGFNNSAKLCCGNWTADAKYFVFQSTSGEVSTLWAVRETADRWRKVSREPVQLTHVEMNAESPLPSKDGKEIFFIGAKPRGEVMRYDLKTHSLAPYLPGFSAQWLGFSGDGQRMAYVSYPQGILWQSRTDGTDRHQLTFPPMWTGSPRWSPDGSQIAFTGGPPGKPGQVFLISAGGGDPEQLTSGNESSWEATWSTDGNSLAYAGLSAIDSKTSLQVLNLKTRKVTVVTDSAGMSSPRWSPDGRYLLAEPMDNGRLMLYDFNLRSWQQLTQGKLEIDYPSWSPDGKCVYFNSVSEKGSPEYRICLNDRKIQRVADMAQAGSLLFGGAASYWTGLAPDGSILGTRDTGTEEIYALDVKFP